MWDRPDILNGISNTLFATAALLAAYGLLYFAVHLPLFPVREVRVVNVVKHVTAEQIETTVRGAVRGTFFTVDLASARSAFESMPWVRSVNVRRQWPDRLDVTLEEHVPFARWGESALVNAQGEVFHAAYDHALPVFAGPAGSAKEIAIQYGHFRRSLAAIGKTPVYVQVSPRRSWLIRLEDGMVLELGRADVEARLERFVSAYGRTISRLGRRIEYVDLRYSNGFAVRVPELRNEKAAPRRGGVA